MNTKSVPEAMNETPANPPMWRRLLLRIALIPVVAVINFAVNLFPIAMTTGQSQRPRPPLLRLLFVGALPGVAWVILSMPVQYATRLLAKQRIPTSVAGHIATAVSFILLHSVLTTWLRLAAGVTRPGMPITEQMVQHLIGFLPMNLVVYTALVAGTLAWDNWRLSLHRERTAAHLAAQLTRAELATLRSRVQPHFLFNALHGISSVMDTDVAVARRMMVSLSHLLRSSLSSSGEYVTLEQELQITRDYLDLQHMRFEERLRYDLEIDADPRTRVPSFILQPLVENAVVHGMADRAEPTRVHIAVRRIDNGLEIDVTDNGHGFSPDTLAGTRTLGLGLGALRARLLALPNGPGTMTLRNRPDGGAQVILRVPVQDEDSAGA